MRHVYGGGLKPRISSTSAAMIARSRVICL